MSNKVVKMKKIVKVLILWFCVLLFLSTVKIFSYNNILAKEGEKTTEDTFNNTTNENNIFFNSLRIQIKKFINFGENIIDGLTKDNKFGIITRCYFEAGNIYDIYADRDVSIYSQSFRIPFGEITNNGVIIIGGDARYLSASDVSPIDVVIKRSIDYGNSFFDTQIVMEKSNIPGVTNARVGDCTILVDRDTNRVFLFALRQDTDKGWQAREATWRYKCNNYDDAKARMVYKYSDDDGATWSEEISLEGIIDKESEITAFGGIGKGITMHDGTLVLPIQVKMISDNYNSDEPDENGRFYIQSTILYSKDHGNTWTRGKMIPATTIEPTIVEIENGTLLINCKTMNHKYRLLYTTNDLGLTWNALNVTSLQDPLCKGSMDKILDTNGTSLILFANPDSANVRHRMTLKISENGIDWNSFLCFYKLESGGYSCIFHDDEFIYLVYEVSGYSLCFTRIPQEFLRMSTIGENLVTELFETIQEN